MGSSILEGDRAKILERARMLEEETARPKVLFDTSLLSGHLLVYLSIKKSFQLLVFYSLNYC
jgi:hypothetical protein